MAPTTWGAWRFAGMRCMRMTPIPSLEGHLTTHRPGKQGSCVSHLLSPAGPPEQAAKDQRER